MRRWKRWEEEIKTPEYQFSHGTLVLFRNIIFWYNDDSILHYFFIGEVHVSSTKFYGLTFICACIEDPERIRFARETSFGRRHLSSWTANPVLIWIVSQFNLKLLISPLASWNTLMSSFLCFTNLQFAGLFLQTICKVSS